MKKEVHAPSPRARFERSSISTQLKSSVLDPFTFKTIVFKTSDRPYNSHVTVVAWNAVLSTYLLKLTIILMQFNISSLIQYFGERN
jgi:hypothetical protein